MAATSYRIHSTAPSEMVSELNGQLDSISQRLSSLENGPIQPKSNIDLGGLSGTVMQAALKVVNLGNGTDEHDAVNLGQLNKATDLSKKLVGGPGITIGKGGNGTVIIGTGGTGGTPVGAGLAATYVTQATEAGLPNSRKLTQGTGVTVTDGGAQGPITVAIGQSVATGASPTFAGLSISGALTLGTPLAVAQGGTGTTTPALVQGTGVTITGTWPNQTIAIGQAVGTANSPSFAGVTVTGSSVDVFTVNGAPGLNEVAGITGVANSWGLALKGTTGTGSSFGIINYAGTNSSDYNLLCQNASGADIFWVRGDGQVQHIGGFANSVVVGIAIGSTVASISGLANNFTLGLGAPNSAGLSFGLQLEAGTNSSDYMIRGMDAAGTDRFAVYGDGGTVLGSPTGASKGSGTLNVASGIYLNGTAYTNPDYVLEHWARGGIVEFADKRGAAEYRGLRVLSEVERYAQAHYSLPLMDTHRDGDLFERGDLLMASVEESYLYLFDHERRLAALEARI